MPVGPRRPGRPRGASGTATRQALVLAAYRQLAAEGFEGLRTRAVAARAHVDVATLHHHFPTKEALVRGVVGGALTRFRATLPGSGSAADRLRGHFRGLRRLSREDPELFAVMGELALRARRDGAVAEILRDTDAYWHDTLRGLIRAAKREGAIAPGDPDDLAGLVVVALKGTYMLPASSREPRLMDRTLRQLERGLWATPRRR